MIIMLFFLIFFVLAVVYFEKYYYGQILGRIQRELTHIKGNYQQLLETRESLDGEKMTLENRANQIFTLYDMTKEIAKTYNEKEAFEIFQKKLKENVLFDDCQFVEALAEIKESILQKDDYAVFPLQSKREKLGYIAVKGVDPKDKEKVAILGHQFALGLRRVKLYQEVEELSITDSLTSAATRRHCLERFDEELKRSANRKIDLSFLMIDVDHFKSVNDQYGHLVGDQILKNIARIIKENIREIDIVGRFGGEEFCVVLPETGHEGAHFAAERIRTAIEKAEIKAYDASLHATVSIGIAVFPANGKKSEELIDKADWALYRAKKRGRNCVCAFSVYEE